MWSGGGQLTSRAPVFTPDGKRCFLCSGASVRILSTSTGEQLSRLQGHEDDVTSVAVAAFQVAAKAGPFHAWTSSKDGTVRQWDYTSGALLRKLDVGVPIKSMVIPSFNSANTLAPLVAYLSVYWHKPGAEEQEGEKQEVRGRVFVFDLAKGTKGNVLAKLQNPAHLVQSPSGGLIGLVCKRVVYVWSVPEHKELKLHHTKPLTCLAFHPSETVVAAGDNTGRILAWYDVGKLNNLKPREPTPRPLPKARQGRVGFEGRTKGASLLAISRGGPQGGGVRLGDDAGALSTWHWHAHPVGSLTFNEDGAYLLSVGKEGVLVIWQVETGARQYLPRLGAPIRHISRMPDPTMFAIAGNDNSIKIINTAAVKVERSMQGIKPQVHHPKLKAPPVSALLEPHEGRVVFPTLNAELQFYNAENDRSAKEVQVVPRNYVSGPQAESLPPIIVTQVAFSQDGSVMGTVDLRLAESKVGEAVCLKFWHKDQATGDYTLNTRVDEPHSKEVTSLVYHPTEDRVVSASLDGEFKVWAQRTTRVSGGATPKGTVAWQCQAVAGYRSLPLRAAAFSWDGSLLAIAADNVLTLWNSETQALVRAMPIAGVPHQPISTLHFAPKSPCLVLTYKGPKQPLLVVWNVLTTSVWWSYALDVQGVAMDPAKGRFAVTTLSKLEKQLGYAVVFDVERPAPVAAWVLPKAQGCSLVFVPPEHNAKAGDSSLLVITRSREYTLLSLTEEEEQEPQGDQGSTVDTMDIEGPSPYEALYGKPPSQTAVHAPVPPGGHVFPGGVQKLPWGGLLSGPSHVLPSLTRICPAFMEKMLQKVS